MDPTVFRKAARFPLLAVGLCSLAFVLVKTGRDTLFFSSRELTDLALAFGLIALMAIPSALGHLGLMKRLGSRCARLYVMVGSAGFFFAVPRLVDFEEGWAAIGLFAVVPIVFSAIFASVWLLAGDLLEGSEERETAWAYTRLGAGSLVGGTLGGAIARVLALFGKPENCMAAGGVALLMAAGIVLLAHRRCPAAASPRSTDVEPVASLSGISTGRLMRLPFLVAMTTVAGLMALVGQFIDFQFYAFVKLSGSASASFFAEFYALLNGVALLLQLLVTPLVQSRVGVAGALLVLPVGLLGSTSVVALSSNLVSRSLLKLTENGLKSAIHRSTWEQAFLALHRKSRSVAKVIVDGMSVRTAEGLGAVALYSLLCFEASELTCLNWLTWALFCLIAAWIVMTAVLIRLGCDPVGDPRYQVRLPGS